MAPDRRIPRAALVGALGEGSHCRLEEVGS